MRISNPTRSAVGAVLAVCLSVSAVNARPQGSSPAASSSTGTSKSTSTAKKKHRRVVRSTSSKSTSSKSRRGKKVRGQQKIDSERAQQIQEALIREHYLNGEATGTWNQASEDAMRKYQADHGWQSKTVPDSRALISLGLGPSHDHLLNPESAMTTGPVASGVNPTSRSAEPAATPGKTPSSDPATPASVDSDGSKPQ